MRIKLEYPLTLQDISDFTELSSQEAKEFTRIEYICTDSRISKPGDLFFPLAMKESDALMHIKESRTNGCYIAAENYFLDKSGIPPRKALLYLAKLYKRKLKYLKHTVAITGSVGKTTTKELIKTMLSQKYIVHYTSGNLNNDIGLSYTILSSQKNTEILVLELGMNHPGEIKELADVIVPDIAVITAITSAHIGQLGSRAEIAKAKLEICSALAENGKTVVPHEEPLLSVAHNKRTVSTTDPKANFFLFPLEVKKDGCVFDFYSETAVLIAKKIPFPGKHMLSATAFSLAVASLLKLTRSEIENGIRAFSDIVFRQKIISVGRFKVFDDTYSSSPEAASNMLNLISLFAPYKKSALLGDMLELGAYAEKAHYNLGKEVYAYGYKKLYTFGNYAKIVASGALDSGMRSDSVFINPNTESPEISANQIAKSYSDELILFKASHSLHAERIYGYLKEL